ncbi:S1C family serine protease [Conexibacter sp. CPCC 206217]|uniref:S1C family serine protease n=1 Tax=Conexibacter sp. CPCC 206217 TaxID=3064574 RepID=UPI00271FB884|nr:trypsin-like peptidase domain-containing protein [Conexibacter sp. CPCC 206217]MDO8210975.1 trypsin-like peptidase domain-containing protein [Conexibacter sp. CPCC 206217]
MRALVRSPFVAALAGGAVVAVALLALGVSGADHTTTTVIQQAAMSNGAGGATLALTARDIYDRDAPGVVYVRAGAVAQTTSTLGRQQADPQGATTGTGFVIDDEGHILTNHHVVGDAKTVNVRFGDETTVKARVLGQDETNDLALLKVDPASVALHPLTLGDSSDCRVGDPVIAIGNPLGLDRTLTTGVVSALQRQLRAPNGFTIQHVIQTDTAINPGNSGGPLLDSNGRVIGINSQIATTGSGGGAGIAFAIPINTAKTQLEELKRTGSVRHSYVGITGVTIDERLGSLRLGARRGVLVQAVHPGSPAAAAGLRGGTIESQVDGETLMLRGDVLTSIDGETLRSMEQLTTEVADRQPGAQIKLGVLRAGASMQLTLTLGVAPKQLPDQTAAP